MLRMRNSEMLLSCMLRGSGSCQADGLFVLCTCAHRIGLNDYDWEMGCSSWPLPHPTSQIQGGGNQGGGSDTEQLPPSCEPPSPECVHEVKPPGGPGWVWSDGSLVDFGAWSPGQPNAWSNGVASCDTELLSTVTNVGGSDCACAYRGGAQWDDGDSCGSPSAYACGFECNENDAEYHVSVPGDTATDIRYCQYDTTSRTCADIAPGLSSNNILVYGTAPPPRQRLGLGNEQLTVASNCRYEFHANALPFQEAEDACVASGGHLASVHSIDEYVAIADMVTNTAW